MLIIRDMGIHKIERFNRLLDHIPGLTPRSYSRTYSKGAINASKGASEGRVDRMHWEKEISNDGSMETH